MFGVDLINRSILNSHYKEGESWGDWRSCDMEGYRNRAPFLQENYASSYRKTGRVSVS
jgi:hypothetical protein